MEEWCARTVYPSGASPERLGASRDDRTREAPLMEADDLKREIEALRALSATLNAAILRINASLDLDTVLDEVMESARALTGARWGALVER